MDKYKSLELFNIKVVRKRAEGQFNIPLDDRLPTFNNIIGIDNFMSVLHIVNRMIDDDALKVKTSRSFHIWCHRCGQYVGFKEFAVKLVKHNRLIGFDPDGIVPARMQRHDAWCPSCHSMTSFSIQEEISTLY